MVTSEIKPRRVRDAYHHGNLRTAAVAAALELIRANKGPFFSLREVAAVLGVSHGALYRHFADRDALLAAAATEGFAALCVAQRDVLDAAGDDVTERLTAVCRVHFDFATARPAEYRAMFNAFLNGAGADDEPLHAAAKPTLDALLTTVEAWQRGVGADALPTREAAAVVWSAVHGLAVLTLDGHVAKLVGDGGGSSAGMIALVTSTTLAGLAARAREVAEPDLRENGSCRC